MTAITGQGFVGERNTGSAVSSLRVATGRELIASATSSSAERTVSTISARGVVIPPTESGGQPGFCRHAILVYDVSRWGRFQDTDEAAHYEYVCKSAGIPIHYCAEPFSNTGTMSDSLLKTLKRFMAGEYSRDLSARTLGGVMQLVQRGFKYGSVPGYGLRRMLASADGHRKQLLKPGEWKSISSDRVVFVPGPRGGTGLRPGYLPPVRGREETDEGNCSRPES